VVLVLCSDKFSIRRQKSQCLAKMRLNSVQTVFYSFLLLTISPPIVSQTVSPGPTHDCSNQLVYIGDLACNNDLHNCCGATETCCAGGCCSLSEVCVFQGTANEACCPMGDPTFCGEPAAVSCLPRPGTSQTEYANFEILNSQKARALHPLQAFHARESIVAGTALRAVLVMSA
jgi:hypothetical protein